MGIDLVNTQQYVVCPDAAYERQPHPMGREARARPRREPRRLERRDAARPVFGHQDRGGRGRRPAQDAVERHRERAERFEPPSGADEHHSAEQQPVQRKPPQEEQPRGLRRKDDDSRECAR